MAAEHRRQAVGVAELSAPGSALLLENLAAGREPAGSARLDGDAGAGVRPVGGRHPVDEEESRGPAWSEPGNGPALSIPDASGQHVLSDEDLLAGSELRGEPFPEIPLKAPGGDVGGFTLSARHDPILASTPAGGATPYAGRVAAAALSPAVRVGQLATGVSLEQARQAMDAFTTGLADDGGAGVNFRIVESLSSGRYFLRVMAVGGSHGPYTLTTGFADGPGWRGNLP